MSLDTDDLKPVINMKSLQTFEGLEYDPYSLFTVMNT